MAQYNADGIQRAIDDEVVKQMREWIEDCGEDTSGRERPDIVEAVRRNYDGGIKQFLLDGLPEPEEPACTCGPDELEHGAYCDIVLQRDYARGLLRHECRCPSGYAHVGACVTSSRAASLPRLPEPETPTR